MNVNALLEYSRVLKCLVWNFECPQLFSGLLFPSIIKLHMKSMFQKTALTLWRVLRQKRPAEEMALSPLVHVCFQPNGRLQCRQFQVSLPEKEQVGLLHIKAKPNLDLHNHSKVMKERETGLSRFYHIHSFLY